ncbi:hypothetical protein [Halorussus aquaticus]|uniref:Twin-arginine translocation signal domain-containing protein n=1 Tax=Halorussus aquaticus TaxID=2953748 RepID=A0ABD5PX94_9EURY|nr:hypothetical protein [Halorussus aquaticus]
MEDKENLNKSRTDVSRRKTLKMLGTGGAVAAGLGKLSSPVAATGSPVDVVPLEDNAAKRVIGDALSDPVVKALKRTFTTEKGWKPRVGDAAPKKTTVPDEDTEYTSVNIPFETGDDREAYITWVSLDESTPVGRSVKRLESGDWEHDLYTLSDTAETVTVDSSTIEQGALSRSDDDVTTQHHPCGTGKVVNWDCVLKNVGAYGGVIGACASCAATMNPASGACISCASALITKYASEIDCNLCVDE